MNSSSTYAVRLVSLRIMCNKLKIKEQICPDNKTLAAQTLGWLHVTSNPRLSGLLPPH